MQKVKRAAAAMVWTLLCAAVIYLLLSAATGLWLRNLVFRLYEEPVGYEDFAEVILTEQSYNNMNYNIYVESVLGKEPAYELSTTFPITYITWGKAKAIYWMDYESVDFPFAAHRMPVIVEMVWDGGWVIARATDIEFSSYDYGVSFP